MEKLLVYRRVTNVTSLPEIRIFRLRVQVCKNRFSPRTCLRLGVFAQVIYQINQQTTGHLITQILIYDG